MESVVFKTLLIKPLTSAFKNRGRRICAERINFIRPQEADEIEDFQMPLLLKAALRQRSDYRTTKLGKIDKHRHNNNAKIITFHSDKFRRLHC